MNKTSSALATPVNPAPGLKPEAHARLGAAVLKIFSEGDFHSADMRSIAREAGMSFATIYKYYGDKENLLFALIDEWLGALRVRVLEGMGGIENPREKIRRCLWMHLDYYERNPAVGKIVFMTVPLQTWMKDETFAQREFSTLLINIIRDAQKLCILDPALPPILVLDAMFGALYRSFTMWQYRGRTYKLTDQMEPIFRILWHGIRMPQNDARD